MMLDIQEVKRPDLSAQLVAENVATTRRRIAFRRAMKRAVQTTTSLGAEFMSMFRTFRWCRHRSYRTTASGKVPLQTLRANINYGFSEASTVYGIIGVKCWICLPDGAPLIKI